jgi:hypothetical protein
MTNFNSYPIAATCILWFYKIITNPSGNCSTSTSKQHEYKLYGVFYQHIRGKPLHYTRLRVVDALLGGKFAGRRGGGLALSRQGECEHVREAFSRRRLSYLYSARMSLFVGIICYAQMMESLLPPPSWACLPPDVAAEVLKQLKRMNKTGAAHAAFRSTCKGWRTAHD